MSRESIYREIDQERAAQDRKYGGPAHDDKNDASQWADAIQDHAEQATNAADDHTYRRQMIRVAALAVAALESLDRYKSQHAESKNVYVYGASDDLVEIAGDLGSDELGIGYHAKWLAFSDGTLATIAFTESGWTIAVVQHGSAEAEIFPAEELSGLERLDDGHPVLRVRGDVRWVAATDADPRTRNMQPVPDTIPGANDKRELWSWIMWSGGATWASDQ